MNEIPSSEEQEKQGEPHVESSGEETPQSAGTSPFGKLRKAIGSVAPQKTETIVTNTAQSTNPATNSAQPAHSAPQYVVRALKDRNMALILEILPGLFGLYGFGWIYSGNSGVGIMLLVGGLVWAAIAIAAAMLTATAACFCTVPVNIAAVAVSATMLNNYTKNHPELFGK